MEKRRPYPSDVSDEEWSFAAPYLTLMDQDAPQRRYELRELFNALRWLARAGPHGACCRQTFRPGRRCTSRRNAGCERGVSKPWFRICVRCCAWHRDGKVSPVRSFSTGVRCSRPARAVRARYDGYKRKRESKVHMAVDTLGHLLAVHITPANEQERAQVQALAREVQLVTGQTVKLAFADQGYTGEEPAQAAREEGIELQVIKLPEAKNGFVLLPRRWVVERSFGWLNRFRRLARDYERLPETLAGLHFVVFAMLMLVHAASVVQST